MASALEPGWCAGTAFCLAGYGVLSLSALTSCVNESCLFNRDALMIRVTLGPVWGEPCEESHSRTHPRSTNTCFQPGRRGFALFGRRSAGSGPRDHARGGVAAPFQ